MDTLSARLSNRSVDRPRGRSGASALSTATGFTIAILFAAFVAGCTTGGSGSSSSRSGPITSYDVQSSSASNAYDLVRSLRPAWLRSRGATSIRDSQPSMPVVYVDGIREGSPETLRRLNPMIIETIHYLNASDATNRYGTGHVGGAIVVSLKR